MYAACRSPFTTPDTIGKLIQLGFGVDVPNRLPRGRSVGDTSFGSTPLHGVVERLRWAIRVQNNNEEVVNCIQIIGLLQQVGANVTAENNIILSSGKVSKMTASQEFEHVKNDNPFVYNIDKVGELLTTRVEKSLKWNSTTQPIANFYDGAKCTFAYNQGHHADPVHTDDYVNMTITSLQGAHGVGPTGVQLVISTVATPSKTVDKLVTAKTIDAAAAKTIDAAIVAASTTSKLANKPTIVAPKPPVTKPAAPIKATGPAT